MEILLLLVAGGMNILCFFIGAKIGQKVSKGEPIEVPSLNPLEAIREHNSRKEAERIQDRNAIIMENIEKYDGTPRGQKDVPRG
jgi:hypothetical protein